MRGQLSPVVCWQLKPQVRAAFLLSTAPTPATGLCIKDGNLLDSTCGSGHMFSYAFGLRYSIYDDVGYSVNEIPDPILGVNSCDSMENWSLHNE